MSRLSELLNPAPTSGSETLSTTNHGPPVQPLVLDGQNRRASSISYGASGSPTLTRFPPITSPGLEALANAASNTSPILSPTQHSGSFTHSTPYQPTYSQYGSRPTSSHATLPPLSSDFSHAPNHNGSHSSDLEQYHHHSSAERRLSNVTDPSARLPPLHHSPIEHHPSFHSDATQPLNGIADYANGTAPEYATLQSPQSLLVDPHADLDCTTNTPATSQIHQPSSGPSPSLPAASLPEVQSEQVVVKAEITENLLEMPKIERGPSGQEGEGSGIDIKHPGSPAPRTPADMANGASSPMAVDNSSGALPFKFKGPPSKKRAAPKKGTASAVRPAAKKRKLDSESTEGTPSAQRNGTPASRRTSNTPAPKNRKHGSVTPARSSSVANLPEDEEGSEEEDTEAYCICRKPDDHTLMIGCDGPCEDWFHVRCVSMDAVKAKLIFKWYCPNCAEKGHETLWKRMCRLEGCSAPAREGDENKSKYCCDEHGLEFMKARIFDQQLEKKGPGSHKKRRRDNYTDHHGNTEDPVDDDPGHLRGGILRASELKALATGVKDIDAFRRLGEGVLSPPPSASPEGEDVKMENGIDARRKTIYTPEETAHLEEVAAKRDMVRSHKKMLDDRDRLLSLVATRARSVLSELKEQDKSINTICGYDPRLTWSDEEFNEWRASAEGKAALAAGGELGAPTTKEKQDKPGDGENGQPGAKGTEDTQAEEEEIGKGVCRKKRCERHKAWFKLQQQDVLFETHQARQAMKKLEAEEKGVKDRAMIRSLDVGEP